jgi:RNA polymerase sigma factor (sigma-70 family)
MAKIDEADRYLIDQIRRGDADGWSALVARYQGRLTAFARGQLSRKSEAEDLVQETFILFLQAIRSFRDDCSLETYLFTILRRKLIDLFRGRQLRACFINDLPGNSEDSSSSGAERYLPVDDQSASWYVGNTEQADRAAAVLASALDHFIGRLKESENFRDLKIIEMLFFAQIRNQQAGEIIGVDEKQIALIKHRMIKALREKIEVESIDPTDSLLTQVWEQRRFTCPKRSTIGRFLLGTLDGEWGQYVDFHLNKLGCRFCNANVEDLRSANENEQAKISHKIFESTIGFFRPTQGP